MKMLMRWWTGTAQPRARRKTAVAEARWELEMWADYGDPTRLEQAIRTLMEAA